MPSMPELLIVLAIVVLLFGAKKIPELAKGMGKRVQRCHERGRRGRSQRDREKRRVESRREDRREKERERISEALSAERLALSVYLHGA